MSGDTTTALLAELRRGVRTTSELMAAAGVTRNAVALAIDRLRNEGHEIVNVRGLGPRDGLYWLSFDATANGPRICRAEGCITHLSRYNRTPYCRTHLADVASAIYLECVCQWLDEELGEEAEDAQLSLSV